MGREWQASGDPIKVSTHDFPSQAIGKAIPYGIYDIASNEGFVKASSSFPLHSAIRATGPGAKLEMCPGCVSKSARRSTTPA